MFGDPAHRTNGYIHGLRDMLQRESHLQQSHDPPLHLRRYHFFRSLSNSAPNINNMDKLVTIQAAAPNANAHTRSISAPLIRAPWGSHP